MERPEFEKLVDKISAQLHSTAKSILGSQDEAADSVQETLLRLWSIRDRLDMYESPAAVAALILRRICISAVRDRKPSVGLEEAMRIKAIEDTEPIDPLLLVIIDKLPDREQAVLRMKHIDGLETDEIAKLTGSNQVAVRTALSRARKKVRDIYLKTQA